LKKKARDLEKTAFLGTERFLMWEVLCVLLSAVVAELLEHGKYHRRLSLPISSQSPQSEYPIVSSEALKSLWEPFYANLEKRLKSQDEGISSRLLPNRPVSVWRRLFEYLLPEGLRQIPVRSYIFVALYVASIITADRALFLPVGLTAYFLATAIVLCLWDSHARAFVRWGGECFAYLCLFDEAQFLPSNLRPGISLKLMEDWDTFLIGTPAPHIFAVSFTTGKDLLAALAYGLMHYIAPFAAMYFLSRKSIRALQVFARAFGRMNFLAVLIQILFPNVPPWFAVYYGPQAPQYGMRGFPGGLVRVDHLLGTQLFEKEFYEEPMPFASWPSLHACWPLFIGLCVGTISWPFLVIGTLHWCLVCWAVMYLEHHWFFDVLSGSVLAIGAYLYCREDILRAMLKTRREESRSAHIQNPPHQAQSPSFTGWGSELHSRSKHNHEEISPEVAQYPLSHTWSRPGYSCNTSAVIEPTCSSNTAPSTDSRQKSFELVRLPSQPQRPNTLDDVPEISVVS